MKNNFKRCLALLLAIMTIVGAFSIPVSAAETCDHDWKDYSEVKATCTTMGYKTVFCNKCQEYKVSDVYAKLDHTYVEATTASAANCTKHGWEVGAMICSRTGCGAVKDLNGDGKLDKEDKYIPVDEVNGHNYVAGAPVGNPCVDDKVSVTYTCSYNNKHKYTVDTPSATDGKHVYEYTVITEATCGVNGSATRKCKVCNTTDTIVIAKVESHSLSAVKYEKDADGHYAYKACSVCATKFYYNGNTEVETKADAKIAHNVTTWSKKTDSTCATAGYDEGKCTVCTYVCKKYRDDQPPHTYNSDVTVNVVKSSHTPAGVTHGYKEYYCTTCKSNFKIYDGMGMREVPDPLNDHAWYDYTSVPGTCYVGGVTTQKCSLCTATRNVETEKTHNWGANQTEYPTCVNDGRVYKECEYCGISEDIEILPTTNNNGKHGNGVEDKTHEDYVAATCLNKGIIPVVCEDCGVVLEKKNETWAGGDHSQYITKGAAGDGCFYAKYDVYTCSECDDDRYDLVLEAAGSHAYTEIKTLRPASCFEEGILGYECARCGKTTEDSRIPVDADAHAGKQVYSADAADYWKVSNPNTENDGVWPIVDLNEYDCLETINTWWYCNACHRNYRAPMQNKVTVNADIILPAGAAVGEYEFGSYEITGTSGKHAKYIEVLTTPSCFKVGTGIEKCAFCDVETNVILNTIEHIIGEKDGTINPDAKYTIGADPQIIKVTCKTDVKYQIHCVVCNEWLEGGTEKAKDHTWSDWAINTKVNSGDKAATCKATGVESRKCSVCSKVETRSIPVNDQAHVINTASGKTTAYKAPTCTTNGVEETYTCKTCSKKFAIREVDGVKVQFVVSSAVVIPAIGHQSFADALEDLKDEQIGATVPATCTTEGYTPVYCIQCLDDEIEIGWLDHAPATGHVKKDKNGKTGSEAKTPFTKAETCANYAYSYYICANGCDAELDIKETGKTKKAHINAAGLTLTGDCRVEVADYMCKNCKTEITPEHNYAEEPFEVCNVTRYTCTVCDNTYDGYQYWVDGTGEVKHTYVTDIAPTLTATGTEKCVVCEYVNPVKLPKLDAITFSMEVFNPKGGNIVNGGLVHVRVNMSMVQAIEVNNIRVALNFNTNHLVYNGVVKNEDGTGSAFGHYQPESNDKDGVVLVFDDAGKERGNITLKDEMTFVTLEFYVLPTAYIASDRQESLISFVEYDAKNELTPSVSYYDVAASTADKAVYSEYSFDVTTNNEVNLAIDQLGDFDNNGVVNNYDLVAVRDLMVKNVTADEKVYDAVLDINHDGIVDMADYLIIKAYMVAKYEYWQFADVASYEAYVEYATVAKEEATVANYLAWLKK